jgi:hypothetical protein
MATRLTITTPATAWAKLDAELKGFPKELRKVHYAAVKRTADEGRVMIFNRFKEEYPNVQKSKIETGDLTKRKRPIVSKVVNKEEQPTGIITVYDYKIPMIAFKPGGGGMRIPSGDGGVRVRMDKAKGLLLLPHAFRAKMRSGHIGIFSRIKTAGKPRTFLRRGKTVTVKGGNGPDGVAWGLPIRELFGPSIYSLVDIPKINAEVESKLDGILVKNIERQIARVPLLKK